MQQGSQGVPKRLRGQLGEQWFTECSFWRVRFYAHFEGHVQVDHFNKRRVFEIRKEAVLAAEKAQ